MFPQSRFGSELNLALLEQSFHNSFPLARTQVPTIHWSLAFLAPDLLPALIMFLHRSLLTVLLGALCLSYGIAELIAVRRSVFPVVGSRCSSAYTDSSFIVSPRLSRVEDRENYSSTTRAWTRVKSMSKQGRRKSCV